MTQTNTPERLSVKDRTMLVLRIVSPMVIGLPFAAAIIASIVIPSSRSGTIAGLTATGLAFLGVIFALTFVVESSTIAREQQKIEERIDKAVQAVDANPDKSKPLWDLASSRLERYFERNLQQIRWIFWITLVVMVAGFSMIGYGISRAFDDKTITGAMLAAASGVLTEFIAATFLIIYRSTMAQASDYVSTLERINAVGMAIQIVDTIPDSAVDLKNKARADLVKNILDAFGKQAGVKKRKV